MFVKFAATGTVNSKKLAGEYTQHFLWLQQERLFWLFPIWIRKKKASETRCSKANPPPQFSYHSILIQLYYLCQNCLKNFSLDLLIGLLKLYCRHIYIHRISYICYYYCCLFVIPKSMTSKYSSSALPETLIQVWGWETLGLVWHR